jgi:hypothetical protein
MVRGGGRQPAVRQADKRWVGRVDGPGKAWGEATWRPSRRLARRLRLDLDAPRGRRQQPIRRGRAPRPRRRCRGWSANRHDFRLDSRSRSSRTPRRHHDHLPRPQSAPKTSAITTETPARIHHQIPDRVAGRSNRPTTKPCFPTIHAARSREMP